MPGTGAATDRGRWWVAGDELCHKWSRWFSSEPQCIRLRKEGRLIRWRTQDGNTGTAMITVPAPSQLAVASASPLLGSRRPPPPRRPRCWPRLQRLPEPEGALKQPPGELAADAGKQPPPCRQRGGCAASSGTGSLAVEKEPVLPKAAEPEIAQPEIAQPKTTQPKTAVPKDRRRRRSWRRPSVR